MCVALLMLPVGADGLNNDILWFIAWMYVIEAPVFCGQAGQFRCLGQGLRLGVAALKDRGEFAHVKRVRSDGNFDGISPTQHEFFTAKRGL